jgi:hypothetical protein
MFHSAVYVCIKIAKFMLVIFSSKSSSTQFLLTILHLVTTSYTRIGGQMTHRQLVAY